MWCEKCSYGSERATFKAGKCPQCGNNTFENSFQFPKKPLRSIRDMTKRTKMEVDKKTKKVISEEVTEVVQDAGSLK